MKKGISRIFIGFIIPYFACFQLLAAYYDVLPEGVRMLVLKQVDVGTIDATFSNNGQKSQYYLRQPFDANTLHTATPAFEVFFDELQAASQQAYEEFRLATFEADGEAKVKVKAFGVGYGLTNKLSVYGSFPFYKANVNLRIRQVQGNNNEAVLDNLDEATKKNDVALLINQGIPQLPTVNGALLQTVAKEVFNYNDLGDWEGSGPGDFELGVIYQIKTWKDAGLAGSAGLVLPTGRVDDPDILQDIAFGDGQWDIFAEIGGGITALKGKLDFDSWLRYTIQLPATKELRVPTSYEFPLSDTKAEFKENRGDIITYSISSKWHFNDWFRIKSEYQVNYQGYSEYKSSNEKANDILKQGTNSLAQIARLEGTFSTVKGFLKKKFIMPLESSIAVQRTFQGKNTPVMTRFDLELRFLF